MAEGDQLSFTGADDLGEKRSRPIVVNRHHFRGKKIPDPWMYIGRGTPLGNPYTLNEHGDQALELYREWLWAKIRDERKDVLDALRSITPQHRLVCSCKPRPCHGDIVVRAWAWLRRRDGGWTE